MILSQRGDFVQVAKRSIQHLDQYRTADESLIFLPGKASRNGRLSDGQEGFARSMLLLAFLKNDLIEADLDYSARYRRGLVAGVKIWPVPTDFAQSIVESTSIALSLAIAPALFWDPLSEQEKHAVVEYLSIATRASVYANNWGLFPLVIAKVLDSLGFPSAAGASVLTRTGEIDSLYRSGGWYTDGESHRIDYYNHFAFHFYPPLMAHLGLDIMDRGQVTARLEKFVESADGWVASDGRILYRGRSLVYRFGSTAPFWLAEMLGVVPFGGERALDLSSRVMSRIVADGGWEGGNFTYRWNENGKVDRQPYSGPSSPLWASKGFVGLLLTSDAAPWQASPKLGNSPVRVSRLEEPAVRESPGVSIITAHPLTLGRPLRVDDPLYESEIYTTHTAPNVRTGRVRIRMSPFIRAAEVSRLAEGGVLHVAMGTSISIPRRLAYKFGRPAIRIKSLQVRKLTVELESSVLVVLAVRSPRRARLVYTGLALASGTKSGCERYASKDGIRATVVADRLGVSSSAVGILGFKQAGISKVRPSAFGRFGAEPLLYADLRPGWNLMVCEVSVYPMGASGPCARVIEVSEDSRSALLQGDGSKIEVTMVRGDLRMTRRAN
ncbi:DUF2264 domain-containing protein [Salinibacterium sp. G-O1]|uniref:DUF2264 domain-containing protein n=1 Tax=Salinibacterium sp. G-O1 TaxID=3046208 RepID=UPI0024BABB3D|nr:DUF2264 domain-containing protein [Salinibacterium sp. G-O1]MDJ0335413.1 DUF2264 domain-containing protein [Salinibacterium sp. G-O1]